MTDQHRDASHDEPGPDESDPDDPRPDDPRLHEPEGDEGIPGELIDAPGNLPGDQPVDDTPPSRIKATGRD